MRQCVLLSMDDMNGFPRDDQLLIEPLKDLGWEAKEISWHHNEEWARFEAAVIRSTWDYQHHMKKYLSVLDQIRDLCGRLENSYETVVWNIDKAYLRELEKKNVDVVPTLWREGLKQKDLDLGFDHFKCDKIVVKPTVSAGANDTFLIAKSDKERMEKAIHVSKNRPFMIQPFIEEIQSEGEYSLLFFGGEFSHAVLKKPKSGDFRVQEEFGGQNYAVKPDELIVRQALKAISSLGSQPLYARADFVRKNKSYLLMELELVEPSLFLDMDAGAPGRFARVFSERMKA